MKPISSLNVTNSDENKSSLKRKSQTSISLSMMNPSSSLKIANSGKIQVVTKSFILISDLAPFFCFTSHSFFQPFHPILSFPHSLPHSYLTQPTVATDPARRCLSLLIWPPFASLLIVDPSPPTPNRRPFAFHQFNSFLLCQFHSLSSLTVPFPSPTHLFASKDHRSHYPSFSNSDFFKVCYQTPLCLCFLFFSIFILIYLYFFGLFIFLIFILVCLYFFSIVLWHIFG